MVSVGTGLFLEDELEVVGIEQEAEILQDRKYTATRPLNDGSYMLSILYALHFSARERIFVIL